MKRFYCNGKKDFCDLHKNCPADCEYYNGDGGNEIEYSGEAPAPAADVVEVVRCKDCAFLVRKENGDVKCGNTYGMLICTENEYCSRGRRRKNENI